MGYFLLYSLNFHFLNVSTYSKRKGYQDLTFSSCSTKYGSKLDSFPRKRCSFLIFVHVVLLISLEIMQKNYISRFILQGRNIIFKNILRVQCGLRKIK